MSRYTWLISLLGATLVAAEEPRVHDPRLKLELVATAPELRTPVGIAIDRAGRVYVVENHTHFRPPNYQGPPSDRILRFMKRKEGYESEVFFEGSKNTMNLGIAPSGELLVATRSTIFKLTESDRFGKSPPVDSKCLVFLKTPGNYPHNGLSGFAFDAEGNVYFGLGENLGADYEVMLGNREKLTGGGEGGSIYSCSLDGTQLKRIATGFWNPFHLAFDPQGNLFTVDNDPDSRPPCRLLHVVAGGDYGYRFRNGRKGLHPFTSWNGENPGTLPMMSGTGEAPSGIIHCEEGSLGKLCGFDLLTTSWGDHRIEGYRLQSRGLSFGAEMKPLVSGDENFRPVGIARHPDGSVWFTDWVDKSYQLHGQGRLWRLSLREDMTPAAIVPPPKKLREETIPEAELFAALGDADPFRAQAARRIAREQHAADLLKFNFTAEQNPEIRLGAALVLRELNSEESRKRIPELLRDTDSRVRFAAVQWIAEERLTELWASERIEAEKRATTRKEIEGYFAAEALLSGAAYDPKKETRGEEAIVKRLLADDLTPERRAFYLGLVRAKHIELTEERLKTWYAAGDRSLRVAVMHVLTERRSAPGFLDFGKLAQDASADREVRFDAVSLLPRNADDLPLLAKLADDSDRALAAQAARSLRAAGEPGESLLRAKHASLLPPAKNARPEATNTQAWLARLEGGDAEAGRLVFHHAVVACNRCHEAGGRGEAIGPNLTGIGKSLSRERLLASILQPSREIAPPFAVWELETTAGKVLRGMYLGEEVDGTVYYADDKGERFKIAPRELESRRQLPQSLMPEGLVDRLTDGELADLLAFLSQ